MADQERDLMEEQPEWTDVEDEDVEAHGKPGSGFAGEATLPVQPPDEA